MGATWGPHRAQCAAALSSGSGVMLRSPPLEGRAGILGVGPNPLFSQGYSSFLACLWFFMLSFYGTSSWGPVMYKVRQEPSRETRSAERPVRGPGGAGRPWFQEKKEGRNGKGGRSRACPLKGGAGGWSCLVGERLG